MVEEKEYLNLNHIFLTNFDVKEEFKDDSYIDVLETCIGANDIELKDSLRQDGILVDDIKIESHLSPTCNMNDNVKIEEEISTDDIKIKFDINLLFCDHCNEHYEDYCTRCGMLAHILNRITLSMTDNKAIKELPDDILEIRESSGHVGVFALKVIPECVKIGPFNGLSTSECPLRLKGGKFIVPEDKLKWLNWMQYINPAKNIFQQNLIPFQHENNLYYHSNREILAGEELLVYFGEEYEDSVNKDTEMDFVAPTEDDVKEVFVCTFCCLGFSSRIYLAKHKSICPNETNGMFSIDELVQCPVCKNYFYEKEYLECHKPYCNERDVRKSIPLSLTNQTIKLNRRKSQRLHSCTLCKYRTAYKGNLKRHTNKHNEVKDYRCEICYRQFKTKVSLKLHVEKMHINVEGKEDQKQSSGVYRYLQNEEFDNKTEIYDFKTRIKQSLEKLMKRKHPKEFSYECEICDYKTNIKYYLVNHVKEKHLKEFRYKCETCDYKTNKKSRLEDHIKTEHLKQFSYECEECDYKANSKPSLKNHIKTKHLKEFRYRCEICDYKTYQRSILTNHKKSVHLKEFRYKCEICDYKTNQNSMLNIHKNSVHLKEFTHKCEICDYKTNKKSHLEGHKNTHMKERKYKCEICDCKTNSKSYLDVHIKSTHLNGSSNQCELSDNRANWKTCSKTYAKANHLKKFSYKCEICDYNTNEKSHLEVHIKSRHLKEFSNQCEQSDNKAKPYLEAHIKSKLKKSSYECEICDFKTNCELYFVNHMKLIHQAR